MRLVRRGALFAMGMALAAAGCFDVDVVEGPSEVPQPRRVRVHIEYRQPNGCLNALGDCTNAVIFFGSWMQSGNGFALVRAPGTYIWTGTAEAVPVNYPPRDEPYLVRVYDPHVVDTPTGGITADRLRIGGQIMEFISYTDTPYESGEVYIDDAGVGHNPY